MIRIYLLMALGLMIYILIHTKWFKALRVSWKNFMPSVKTNLTMFDVRDCILKGEKELAIRVYEKIFQVGEEESRRAVDQLERSIQEKNES